MTELLADYSLFLAKLFTVLLALFLLIGLIAALARRGAMGEHGLQVERLNDHFDRMRLTLQRTALDRAAWKRVLKSRRAERKARRKDPGAQRRRRLFVLDFKGDLRASATAALREEVSAILSAAREGDRVLLRLENYGGTVHEHGLAASQLARLKGAGIELIVAVDKVAASGGYLMAAVANRILAAPFAILGSIGVVAQVPNVHRWLEARGIDFEMLTAGRHKRTLTVFARNTEEGREKLQEQIEDVHALFKSEVGRHRGELDVDAVATGEAWYGARALELKLVDEIRTSDDFLLEASRDCELLRLRYHVKRRLQERFTQRSAGVLTGLIDTLADRHWRSRFLR